MKILFLCHRMPYPPTTGGKVRAFNMIRHLKESGHQVHVATIARTPEEASDAAGLREHCHHVMFGLVRQPVQIARMVGRLPTTTPSTMGYFHSPALARRIRDALARTSFDLIIAHSSSMGPYIAAVPDIPKIMDFCDMDSQKWLAYAGFHRFPKNAGYWLEGVKLMRAEKQLAARFTYCTCATELERQTLLDYNIGAQADWFQNGVDTERFAPDDSVPDPDMLSFIGLMNYYPNAAAMVRFCTRILPKIRTRRPHAGITIVGAEPDKSVRALAALPGVTVTGRVADVRSYVRRSAIMVAPLDIARGVQNKLLEAMAMGVPVVCSALAARGVDAIPGEHLLTATSDDEYAERIVGLMNDPEARQRLASAGRARMLSHHTWSKTLARLDNIVERACGG